MTAANYRTFVERMIIRYEGGYGWDKGDPGGPTKYGITCWDLAEHRHIAMNSMSRWAPLVQAMTLQEADDIYQEKYASACRFNDLQTGTDCVVFDFAVNSGSSRAIKYAQGVANVAVDGVLGPKTLAAINGMDGVIFVNDLCDVRLHFMQRLATWKHFGAGWSARVKDLRAYSLRLISQPEGKFEAWYKSKSMRVRLASPKAWDDVDVVS